VLPILWAKKIKRRILFQSNTFCQTELCAYLCFLYFICCTRRYITLPSSGNIAGSRRHEYKVGINNAVKLCDN